jgi:hypothetical protein
MLEISQVAVTVLSCPAAPELEKETFFCATADVSVGGIRVRSLVTPPVGAKVQLLIAFSTPVQSFRHIGTVAWLGKRDADGRRGMGVEFTETAESVFAQWRQVVDGKLKGPVPASR